MRIAYLTQSYPPMISGAAIVTEKLATAMAKRGHKVLVIAASDREYPYHIYEDNLTVLRLSSFNNPMRIGQRFLFYPRHQILGALQEFHPDLIHLQEPLQTCWLGLEYARRAGIPITLTLHQLPWFAVSYLPNILKIRSIVENTLWLYARWILRKVSSSITPSHTISKMVAKKTGILPNTISNGISLETFHPPLSCDNETELREKLNLPSRVPIILHLGRLDIDKHVERVIQAVAQAMQQTEAYLLIVGDGCEKQALIEMCKALGIADRVRFPGFIRLDEGLPNIYRLASLFITASEIEIQSIVLLEAIASGLPIVAVRASFIPEIVRDGINGYLAEPGDIYGLSEAIKIILKNPEKSKDMGRESRVLAEKNDIYRSWEAHEQLYAELIYHKHNLPTIRKGRLIRSIGTRERIGD